MKRPLALCLVAAALVAGCQSYPLSVSVSPRLTGQVLDADTRQPLAKVKIRNYDQTDDFQRTTPTKGGQRMTAKEAVWTDQDGRFTMDTERVLAPFRSAGWFSVRLLFERAGYERFLTNYSYLNLGTNSLNGKDGLDAGFILLQPTPKPVAPR
jgi:5-hydroxyisourate hydrolase-like protein (transthyretin family)